MLNLILVEPKPAPDTAPINRPAALTRPERQAGLAAAARAKKRYPGPVGQVLHDAIKAYLDFGYRADHVSPVPKLIAVLVTDR